MKSKRLRRVIFGAVTGFVLAAAAAIAAFLIVGTVQTSVTTGEFAVFGTAGGTIADGDETAGTCTVALVDAGTGSAPVFSVAWTGGPISGDTCTATLGLQAGGTNAKTAVVEGADIGTGITGGELTVLLDGDAQLDCGLNIAAAAAATITATFTITNAASPGQALATDATFDIVPLGTENLVGCV